MSSVKFWILALLIAFAGGGITGRHVANVKFAEKWDARDAADAEALVQQQAAARAEEQRRQAAITGIIHDAEQKNAALRADADSAVAAGQRLQQESDKLRRKLRASESACRAGAAGSGPSAADAIDLYAELFAEADRVAGEMASAADSSRNAGMACENIYNGVGGHNEQEGPKSTTR